MNIRINEQYSFVSDNFNISLVRHSVVAEGENAGKSTVKAIGHYTTLTQAINGLIKHTVKQSVADNFPALAVDVHKTVADVKKAIGGKFELRYIEPV